MQTQNLTNKVNKKSLPENRGDQYENAKNAIQNKLLQVLYEQYPLLQAQVNKSNSNSTNITSGSSGSDDEFEMEVFGGTPLSNEFYLNASAGEVRVYIWGGGYMCMCVYIPLIYP